MKKQYYGLFVTTLNYKTIIDLQSNVYKMKLK